MVTPVEPRNFVSVVPAAKKSKLGPIFFLNIRFMYKLSVKKQRTGQKTGKNPPKKVVFPAPPISWLSFSEKGPGPFPDFRKRTRSLSGFPEKVPVIFCWNKIEPRYGISAQAGYVGSTINFFYSAKWDLCFTSGCRGPGELHEWWCLFGSRTFSITDKKSRGPSGARLLGSSEGVAQRRL